MKHSFTRFQSHQRLHALGRVRLVRAVRSGAVSVHCHGAISILFSADQAEHRFVDKLVLFLEKREEDGFGAEEQLHLISSQVKVLIKI